MKHNHRKLHLITIVYGLYAFKYGQKRHLKMVPSCSMTYNSQLVELVTPEMQ